MPRQGNDPLGDAAAADQRRKTALLTCKGCGHLCKNKSGYTQHTNRCSVLLERRLRAARERAPANDRHPEGNPDGMDWEVEGGGGQDDEHPLAAGGDGGAAGGDGGDNLDEPDDSRRRATREVHMLMTGALQISPLESY